jgi:hypothetical protein
MKKNRIIALALPTLLALASCDNNLVEQPAQETDNGQPTYIINEQGDTLYLVTPTVLMAPSATATRAEEQTQEYQLDNEMTLRVSPDLSKETRSTPPTSLLTNSTVQMVMYDSNDDYVDQHIYTADASGKLTSTDGSGLYLKTGDYNVFAISPAPTQEEIDNDYYLVDGEYKKIGFPQGKDAAWTTASYISDLPPIHVGMFSPNKVSATLFRQAACISAVNFSFSNNGKMTSFSVKSLELLGIAGDNQNIDIPAAATQLDATSSTDSLDLTTGASNLTAPSVSEDWAFNAKPQYIEPYKNGTIKLHFVGMINGQSKDVTADVTSLDEMASDTKYKLDIEVGVYSITIRLRAANSPSTYEGEYDNSPSTSDGGSINVSGTFRTDDADYPDSPNDDGWRFTSMAKGEEGTNFYVSGWYAIAPDGTTTRVVANNGKPVTVEGNPNFLQVNAINKDNDGYTYEARIIKWAATNIYIGDDGIPTFKEDDASNKYQGVFFKWGSLKGISPITNNGSTAWDPDVDAVYAPDGGNTGTWHLGANALTSIKAYNSGTDKGLGAISLTDLGTEGQIDENDATGDICKFLSAHNHSGNFTIGSKWRLPTADEYLSLNKLHNTLTVTDPSDPNNNGVNENVLTTYIDGDNNDPDHVGWFFKNDWNSDNLTETITTPGGQSTGITNYVTFRDNEERRIYFPASGGRNYHTDDSVGTTDDMDGSLKYVNLNGLYWSGTATTGSAYHVFFKEGTIGPAYNYGTCDYMISVRCVRE